MFWRYVLRGRSEWSMPGILSASRRQQQHERSLCELGCNVTKDGGMGRRGRRARNASLLYCFSLFFFFPILFILPCFSSSLWRSPIIIARFVTERNGRFNQYFGSPSPRTVLNDTEPTKLVLLLLVVFHLRFRLPRRY